MLTFDDLWPGATFKIDREYTLWANSDFDNFDASELVQEGKFLMYLGIKEKKEERYRGLYCIGTTKTGWWFPQEEVLNKLIVNLDQKPCQKK